MAPRIPRTSLAVLVAVVLLAGCGAAKKVCAGANPAAGRSVRTVMPLGAAVDWEYVKSSPVYAQMFLKHFQWMTPENELKMDALEPSKNHFDFGTADDIVDWARGHHERVHGHVLIWGEQLPGWLATKGSMSKADALQVMRTYIGTVLRHFRGRVTEWDVVNEAIGADGSWVHNLWYDSLGPAYVTDAFRIARAAAPSDRLCYNDDGIEAASPHASAVLTMVKRLRARHLIDCVGVESHLVLPPPAEHAVAAELQRFANTGVSVRISELDVKLAPGASLREQARAYTTMARACRSVSGCDRVTTWGFTDATSWLGVSSRALPFDRDCRPKPAWSALETALAKRR